MTTKIKDGKRIVATFDDRNEAVACAQSMARVLRKTLSIEGDIEARPIVKCDAKNATQTSNETFFFPDR